MFEPQAIAAAPTSPDWLAALSGRSGGFAPDRRFVADALARVQPADAAAERVAAAAAEAERVVAEAFAAGLAQGRAEGEDKLTAERASYERLRLSIARLDEAARRDVAERLAATVTALCEVALTPLALDADALQRRCLAAADLLGEAQERLELHLNPDDLAALDPAFSAGWVIVPRPDFARGALRIEGAEAGVADGPAEWRAALEAALAC